MDYSNLAMIVNGVISLEPVSASLWGLTVEQLGDEAVMVQFDQWVESRRWYPLVDGSPQLKRYQSYTDESAMEFDAAARQVRLVRAVRDWTPDEIHVWKIATNRFITHLALRNRFTHAEKVAFEMAMLDNPSGTQDERLAAAGLRVMDKDIAAARHVDLNMARLQEGLRLLEQIGVLAAGRADEIIWGDIEDDEVA